MGNWVEDFQEYLMVSGRSSKTVEAYLSDLRVFGAWFEEVNAEGLRPERVTGVDCHDFRADQLQTKRVAPSTWNRRRVTLIVFAQWAIDQGYLKMDPMDGVPEKPVEELPPRWLDEGEYRQFVRYLDKQINIAQTEFEIRRSLMYRAICALMLYAGLRVDEVCSLDLEDLTIRERSGWVVVREGKGDKQATLPLKNPKARKVISDWLAYREEHHPDAPLWFGRRMGRLGTRAVQEHFKVIRKTLELEFLTPHSLRHTFVRRLLVVKKVPVNIVQKLARHAKVETTLSYAGPSWRDLEDAVESL